MSLWGQLSFQDAASPTILQLIAFHDHAILIIILVLTFVGYFIILLVTNSIISRKTLEANELETIWTILPAVILIFLALPSLRLLYLIDEVSHPQLTLKAVGHQWYWRYEYSDFSKVEFDSYIIPSEDTQLGNYRLLEVDHRIVIPSITEIRLLISSADVIHSWSLPSAGLKVDAVPGRLNQLGFSITHPGVFYGQCSEICGSSHSFIPIAIESVPVSTFTSWLLSAQSE